MGFGGRFGGQRQGGGFRGRSQGGNRGGKKSAFVRIGNVYEQEKRPDGAEYQLAASASGKYLDAVREVINNNDAVRFTITKWNDADIPVLSVAPAMEQGRSTGGARRPSGGSGFGGRKYDGSRGRSIEPPQDEPEAENAYEDGYDDGQQEQV